MCLFLLFSLLVPAERCGVGPGVSVQTLEAAPEGLPPPTVKAAGANVLEIHWSPPKKPNGLITSYHIYRYHSHSYGYLHFLVMATISVKEVITFMGIGNILSV